MANTIVQLSYSNTFGESMVTTNRLITENNNLAANNYTKNTGTLYLNDPSLGLQVANNAILGGLFQVVGGGSSAYVQNGLRVDGAVTLTNTKVALYSSGNIVGNATIYANSANVGLYVSNNEIVAGNLTVLGVTVLQNASANNITANSVYGSTVNSNISFANTALSTISNTITSVVRTALFANTAVGFIQNFTVSNQLIVGGISNLNLVTAANLVSTTANFTSANVAGTANVATINSGSLNSGSVAATSLTSGSATVTGATSLNTATATSLNSTTITGTNITASAAVNAASINATTGTITTLSAPTVSSATVTVTTQLNGNTASAFFNNLSVGGQLSVAGNFVVNGLTVYNSNNFVINSGSSTAQNSFYSVNRGSSGANAAIRWNESAKYWDILDVNNLTYYPVVTSEGGASIAGTTTFNNTITNGTAVHNSTLSAPSITVTGPNLYVNNTTNLLVQHDGSHAYIRPQNPGSSMFLGANNQNMLTLNPTLGLITGSYLTAGAAIFNAANAPIELGSPTSVNSPFMDFHSSGNNIDYDFRAIASGGSAIVGSGNLSLIGTNLYVNTASLMTLGTARVGSTTASISPTTGALTVAGGVGIAGNLNVGATAYVSVPDGNVGMVISGNSTTPLVDDFKISRSGTETATVGTGANFVLTNSTTNSNVMLQQYSNNLQFFNYTGGGWSERARLDSNGNFGLGITPLPASTGRLFVAGDVVLPQTQAAVMGNVYYNAGWKYANNGTAGSIKFGGSSTSAIDLIPFALNSSGSGASAALGGITTIDPSGNMKITTTTASISPTTGALTVAGGVGVSGQLNITGPLWMGTTGPGPVQFANFNNITGGTNAYAAGFNNTILSDVTTTAVGINTYISTQPVSFNLSNLYHFTASQGTIGAGSSISTQAGFVAGSTLSGATSNFGFFGNVSPGAGNYNLYMPTAAQNYLGGITVIGNTTATTSPGAGALVVSGGVGIGGGLSVAGAASFGGQISATTTGSTSTLRAVDSGVNGANLLLAGNGATTPNKYIRAAGGGLQILNNGYSAVISQWDDNGNFYATSFNGSGSGLTGVPAASVVGTVSAATTAVSALNSTFATANTASEGQVNAMTTGALPAYLFNNSGAWGLYSATGGIAIQYIRATGLFSTGALYNTQTTSLGVGTAATGTVGEIRATNNITAYYSSDKRLKENIQNIQSPLEKLAKINGVTFDWTQSYIDEHGGEDGYFIRKNDVGVIAQDVELVLPELVATREDGFKAVRYDRLVALLIESVKDQQKTIDKLESRISELENR